MNKAPKKSPDSAKGTQFEHLYQVSEREVYDFVHQHHLFKQLDQFPAIAKTYYTYAINNAIKQMHKNKRLTTLFHAMTKSQSTEESELKKLLPSKTVAKYLTRLNLTFLKKEEIETLIEHLPEKLEFVSEINLAHTYLPPKSLQMLLKKSPNLKNLLVTNNETDHTYSLTASDFVHILKLFPHIEKFELHNKYFDKLKDLDTHGIKLDDLSFFYLSNAPLTKQDFVQFLTICPNLKEAEFNRCENLKDLDEKSFPQLEKLEILHLIGDANLNSQDLVIIAQKCPHLKKIYLTKNPISTQDIPTEIKKKIIWR